MQWSMPILWLAAILVLGFLEAATTQLVTIWFAAGALVALLASLFGAPLLVQIVLFVLVSVISLVATRPLVRKYLNNKKEPTNADRAIGRIGIVQQTICNTKAEGAVTVDGTVWTARSATGEDIPAGAKVIAERIEGVKLIVSNYDEKGE